MTLRKAFQKVHLVVGLFSALMLLVSSSTGCLLVFEKELHSAINRKLMRIPAQGERLGLGVLVSKVEQANPGKSVSSLSPSLAEDGTTLVTLRAMQGGGTTTLYVNPYTAEVVGSQSSRNRFMEQLRLFHRTLLLGEKGKIPTALGAASLVVLSVTGVILWCRQRLWRWNGSVPGRRRIFEVHNVFGIYASGSMLVFAITGLGIFWEKDATRVVNRLLGIPESAPGKPVPAGPDAVPLSIEQIEASSRTAAPGATLLSIDGIGGLRNPLKLRLCYPGDYSPARRRILLLDPTTGNVLASEGPSFKLWNQMAHTGEILGWPTRIGALLGSLSVPVLALSGTLIWWGRRRTKPADSSQI